MIGTIINEYTLLRQLGEGGMATVYYAENKAGKPVAIKILKEKYSKDNDISNRFVKEAQIMRLLQEVSGIRKVEGSVKLPNGNFAIIMEYLDGCDLKEYIKLNGVIKDSQFIRNIGKQVLTALNEAHKLKNGGIIHRDIKPSNLFLTKSGEIKILDFGISKILFGEDGDATERETSTRQQMGTISYMSPEQIRSTANVDCRTDIYSFGATLYYLMTGNDPLEMDEDSYDEIGDKDLILAIKHATRKNVDKRTPSCDAFLKELLITNAVLNIKTNLACLVYVDGVSKGSLSVSDTLSLELNEGEYAFEFISIDNSIDKISTKYQLQSGDVYAKKVNLLAVRNKRLKLQASTKDKNEYFIKENKKSECANSGAVNSNIAVGNTSYKRKYKSHSGGFKVKYWLKRILAFIITMTLFLLLDAPNTWELEGVACMILINVIVQSICWMAIDR